VEGTAGAVAPVEMWSRRLAGVGAAATALALLVATLTGVVLLWRYRPEVGATTSYEIGGPTGRGPVGWHLGSLVATVAASVWWTCMSALRAVAWRGARTLIGVIAALATLLLCLAASLTWYLVEWDQLALRAVTAGTDLRGLWAAGFSEDVRFVLVGGVEVDPDTYARWLLVHLAAPALALATTAIGWWCGRSPQPVRGEPAVSRAAG